MKKFILIYLLTIILSFNLKADEIDYNSYIKFIISNNISFSTKYEFYVNFIRENDIAIRIKEINLFGRIFRFPCDEYYISKNFDVLKIAYAPNESDGFNGGDDGYFKKTYITYNGNTNQQKLLQDILSELKNIDLGSEKTKLYFNSFDFFKNQIDYGREWERGRIIENYDKYDVMVGVNKNYPMRAPRSIYEITLFSETKELVFFMILNKDEYQSNKTFTELMQLIKETIYSFKDNKAINNHIHKLN